MKKLAIATHTALINGKEYDGIGNVLRDNLNDIGSEYYFVRHSMDGKLPSRIELQNANSRPTFHKLAIISKVAPLRYLTEIMSTFTFFTFVKKTDIFIGVDPLNTLAGVLLKKINKVEKIVFFTPDYSPKRFDNIWLNSIYHSIDKYCVKNSDEVWSVSTKICQIRREMGLEDTKNIFVPNVPPTKYSYLQSNKHYRHRLITYGIIDNQLDFKNSILAVKELSKKYPDIEYEIIGNGPEEKALNNFIKKNSASKYIKLLGHMTLEETLKHASRAGVGLALYTGAWGFNQFGDSTKCREYMFFGLPILTTDSHSTTGEIVSNKAGIVSSMKVSEYVSAIEKIFDNYDHYSSNSRLLGQKYDGIHKTLLIALLRD